MRDEGRRVLAEDLRMLSFREAARVLGVDRSYVARLVHAGEIRSVLVGTQHRIPVWMLLEWQRRTAA